MRQLDELLRALPKGDFAGFEHISAELDQFFREAGVLTAQWAAEDD